MHIIIWLLKDQNSLSTDNVPMAVAHDYKNARIKAM